TYGTWAFASNGSPRGGLRYYPDAPERQSLLSPDASPSEALTIVPGGKAGIGTTAPSSLLDVNNGSITVRGTNAGISVNGSPVLTAASGSAALASTQSFTGQNTFYAV